MRSRGIAMLRREGEERGHAGIVCACTLHGCDTEQQCSTSTLHSSSSSQSADAQQSNTRHMPHHSAATQPVADSVMSCGPSSHLCIPSSALLHNAGVNARTDTMARPAKNPCFQPASWQRTPLKCTVASACPGHASVSGSAATSTATALQGHVRCPGEDLKAMTPQQLCSTN